MSEIATRRSRTRVVLTVYIVLVWFILALLASVLETFVQPPGEPPLLLGLAVVGPIILFLLAYFFSSRFRHFVHLLLGDPWVITGLQTYRILGIVFLVLASRGILPVLFAFTAGWGDVFIGVTAPLIAFVWLAGKRNSKTIFVLWHLLGILDLVAAVSIGIAMSGVHAGQISTDIMRIFPLSLLPTFAVPLSIIMHLAALLQIWTLRSEKVQEPEEPAHASLQPS